LVSSGAAALRLAEINAELARRIACRPLDYFKPTPAQSHVLADKSRIRLVHGGNRSGKTELGAVETLQRALRAPCEIWAVTTDYGTSVEVQQAKIFRYLPKTPEGAPDPALVAYAIYSAESGFTNRVVRFSNGSILRFHSCDQQRHRLQGTSLDFVWFDEEPAEDIFKECLMRTLDRSGRVLLTLTPLSGLNWIYRRLYLRSHEDPEIAVHRLVVDDNPYIDRSDIEAVLAQYAQREREIRREGLFLDVSAGRVYHAFNPARHVRSDLRCDAGLALHVSFDFNVGFMYCSVWQVKADLFCCIDEFALFDSDTDSQCSAILERYAGHPGGLVVHGDASGYARDTRSGENDYDIIRRRLARIQPFAMRVKRGDSNQPVRGRTNLVNRLFDENRILISGACHSLIVSLEGTCWREGRFEKVKVYDREDERFTVDHPGDTLDYFISDENAASGRVSTINYG